MLPDKHTEKFQDTALLIARWIVAAIFLSAGYAKLGLWSNPPASMPSGMLNLLKFLSIVEPLGAIGLLMGYLTRWAAAGLAIIMAGAILILRFTAQTGFFTSPKGAGLDYNFLILSLCIALVAFGAGKWSLDALRK
jgi:putative oxidoreductase